MSDSFVTPWTLAHQAPLSMEFSRQEYWSELPFPSPGDLPDPGIELASPALIGRFFTTEPPGEPYVIYNLLRFLQTFNLNRWQPPPGSPSQQKPSCPPTVPGTKGEGSSCQHSQSTEEWEQGIPRPGGVESLQIDRLAHRV